MSEEEFLQKILDGCCIASEPTLSGYQDARQTEYETCLSTDTIEGSELFTSLLTMEGTMQDMNGTPGDWKDKQRDRFDADLSNLMSYYDVVPVPQVRCPMRTHDVYSDAKNFEMPYEDCRSFKEWLQKENDDECEERHMAMDALAAQRLIDY
jgi:hypothetical protein